MSYGDLKLPVHICTKCIDQVFVHLIRRCTTSSLKPSVVNIRICWASCQADSAAEQLISKSRIFRGRSLGSAMI